MWNVQQSFSCSRKLKHTVLFVFKRFYRTVLDERLSSIKLQKSFFFFFTVIVNFPKVKGILIVMSHETFKQNQTYCKLNIILNAEDDYCCLTSQLENPPQHLSSQSHSDKSDSRLCVIMHTDPTVNPPDDLLLWIHGWRIQGAEPGDFINVLLFDVSPRQLQTPKSSRSG